MIPTWSVSRNWRLWPESCDKDGEDERDEADAEVDLPHDHHEAGGDQGLGHLDHVGEGGRAQAQAGVGHQGAIGVTSPQEQSGPVQTLSDLHFSSWDEDEHCCEEHLAGG